MPELLQVFAILIGFIAIFFFVVFSSYYFRNRKLALQARFLRDRAESSAPAITRAAADPFPAGQGRDGEADPVPAGQGRDKGHHE